MKRKTAFLVLALLVAFVGGLKILHAALSPTYIADNETSGLVADPGQFWIGNKSVLDKPALPTSYLRHGPVWMKSVESALLGDFTNAVTFTCFDALGTNLYTKATSKSLGATGTCPLTFTFTQSYTDSNSLKHYWLDYIQAATVQTSFTTMGSSGVTSTVGTLSSFVDGVATLVYTITAESAAASTQALVLGFKGGIFAGKTVASPTSVTVYIGK